MSCKSKFVALFCHRFLIMSLYIASLNSGSNGNCYYVGNNEDAILVDAGISCRETEIRMKRLGLSINKVKAIFITHEHTDHISGLSVLARKYELPVYITKGTQSYGRVHIEKHLIKRFVPNEEITIGSLGITPFSKKHDAKDPHSFIVSYATVKVGIFTDIGIACKNVITYFKKCNAAFLESNYDEEMLANGSYPFYLKKRITSGLGHLSNSQALQLFKKYKSSSLSHLILSHLSKNNNDPALVKKLFSKNADKTEIIVASRYEETEVFMITPKNLLVKTTKILKTSNHQQLSLF